MKEKPIVVTSHDVHLDSEYIQWLGDIKKRFHSVQVKAALKVNSEQLYFNWQLGKDLAAKKAEEKWGIGIVEQLSLDLQREFPNVKGFSVSNLKYMRQWYSFYAFQPDVEKRQQLVGELENKLNAVKLKQISERIFSEKRQQVVGEYDFPEVFAYLPWGHHIQIVSKCKDIDEAFFYMGRAIEDGWSRQSLQNYISAKLYQNTGGAITNFKEQLPAAQSRLAQEILKDTYDFGFVTVSADYDEDELEETLEKNITSFLLELGTGFAFVGRQKEIIVAGKTRKIDMLFYHIHLRCYIVVELKVKSFEPEFAGKLNFYVNAVNDLLKTENDNPTIGLLICKDKNSTEVQWAFQGISTPMGVASYENISFKEMEASLPSEEQIKQRIELAEEEYKARKNT